MQTMKPFLALVLLLAAATGYPQSSVPAVQQVADARAPSRPSASTKAPAHQLSVQERAELRRQLYEYSRLHGKGS
jgi:hypothetical protein